MDGWPLSHHALPIESGRYFRPSHALTKRVCKSCNTNDTADEIHLLFNMITLYVYSRHIFLQHVRSTQMLKGFFHGSAHARVLRNLICAPARNKVNF